MAGAGRDLALRSPLELCAGSWRWSVVRGQVLVELAEALLRAGLVVTRLKGGDPVLFGRGAEEAQELVDAGIAFEIVPGITSAIAGPAYAGIPVTHRSHCSQLTIFTGHEDPTKPESSLDFAKIAQADGTKVMLMGVERIAGIASKLIEHGAKPSTPVALTPAGEALLPHTRALLDQADALRDRAARIAGSEPVRLGYVDWMPKDLTARAPANVRLLVDAWIAPSHAQAARVASETVPNSSRRSGSTQNRACGP